MCLLYSYVEVVFKTFSMYMVHSVYYLACVCELTLFLLSSEMWVLMFSYLKVHLWKYSRELFLAIYQCCSSAHHRDARDIWFSTNKIVVCAALSMASTSDAFSAPLKAIVIAWIWSRFRQLRQWRNGSSSQDKGQVKICRRGASPILVYGGALWIFTKRSAIEEGGASWGDEDRPQVDYMRKAKVWSW